MSSEQTHRLKLPYLMPSQAQKAVTVNQALRHLDGVIHACVDSRQTLAQPGSVQEGEGWILPDGATGEPWASWAPGDLALYQDGAWMRYRPYSGMMCWVKDEAQLYVYHGENWQALAELIESFQNLSSLGIGTTADANNPLSAKLNSVLFSARYSGEGGNGDILTTHNKETAGDTASVLFKTHWSTRAELGLLGDDTLTLRASTDGSQYSTIFRSVEGGAKTAWGPNWPNYKTHIQGELGFTPQTSGAPVANGDVVMVLESDTMLVFKAKGRDGQVREARLSLT